MKNNALIRMKVGRYISFLDSLQLMNQKLDTLGKIMLNVPKLDIGYKYFSRELLQEWKKNSTEWNNFENYLARDCVLLIYIITILAKLFFDNYKIFLGVNSTISAIANKIYFSKYYFGPEPPNGNEPPVIEDENLLNKNEIVEDL